jgi:riboflavin biosynthesis pyrimidine reductase
VTPEGRLEEGVPGAHSPDEFSLPPVLGTEPASVLTDLFGRGVRSLLLNGRSKLAMAVAEAGLVNRISLYVPRQSASNRPEPTAGRLADAPDGYELTAVVAVGPYVRLELVRS